MSDLENDEVNRQLCAVDEMFDSRSPGAQEQILAEWQDWQHDEPASKEPMLCCDECGKTFTLPENLKRHIQSYCSGENLFSCQECGKSFATKDKPKQHQKAN
jgi:uncharacterized C2H2 Zn-finger protein